MSFFNGEIWSGVGEIMNARCSRTAHSEGSSTSLTWIVIKARYTAACKASCPVRTRGLECQIPLHFHGDPERGWSAYYSSFNESFKSLCHISPSDASPHILNSAPLRSIAMPYVLSTTPRLRAEGQSTRVQVFPEAKRNVRSRPNRF